MRIQIDNLTSEGEGIGSLSGLKVFVEGALPGEEIEISLTEKKKNYARGELLRIISPSSERIIAPCPHFKECGGCQLMHLSAKGQLLYKRQKVVDALRKMAHLDLFVSPCVPSPETLTYRNKVQLPLIWNQGEKKIGFFKKGSHEIVPIQQCLIQTNLGNQLLQTIQATLLLSSVRYVLIKTTQDHQQALLTFVTTGREREKVLLYAQELAARHSEIQGIIENINERDDSVILSSKERLLWGKSYLTETLLGHFFQISSLSFFQVNPKQAEKLFSQALTLAEITSDQIVVDAYCGVGTLAILAASHAKEVIGIEVSKEAIAQAKENARLNQKENCTFHVGVAEKKLEEIEKVDLLFINPPRKGADPAFLRRLSLLKPKTLIYISCNPATLARDLSLLLPLYQITDVIPFDMFPQTSHVETLVKLVLS